MRSAPTDSAVNFEGHTVHQGENFALADPIKPVFPSPAFHIKSDVLVRPFLHQTRWNIASISKVDLSVRLS